MVVDLLIPTEWLWWWIEFDDADENNQNGHKQVKTRFVQTPSFVPF